MRRNPKDTLMTFFSSLSYSAVSRVLLIILALLHAGVLSSCDNSTPVLNIGVLRDSQLETDATIVQAAQLAVERVNANGGLYVNGQSHRVQLIVMDSGNTPQKAIKAAQKLITDQVVAIIGPNTSRTAIPVAGLVETVKIPLITPIATHVDITKNHHYAFRTAFSDHLQGEAMATFARKQLEAKTATIFFDVSNEYSQSLFQSFTKAFEREGGEVVSVETYVTGRTDFTEQIKNIKANPVDVIYLPGNSEVIKAQVTQLRNQEVESILLGGDAWNQTEIATLPVFEGSYHTDHWHAAVNQRHEASALFFDLYNEKFSSNPHIAAMLTYDSINILFEAISKSSGDGQSIQSELIKTQNFNGVTGSISFSEHGETKKPVYILQVKDGKMHLAEEVYPR
jgi:branched-chain amino acid transport system substrate-binding protein